MKIKCDYLPHAKFRTSLLFLFFFDKVSCNEKFMIKVRTAKLFCFEFFYISTLEVKKINKNVTQLFWSSIFIFRYASFFLSFSTILNCLYMYLSTIEPKVKSLKFFIVTKKPQTSWKNDDGKIFHLLSNWKFSE